MLLFIVCLGSHVYYLKTCYRLFVFITLKSFSKEEFLGNSLAGQWLGLGAFTARALVRSLVGELRSYKPHSPPASPSNKKEEFRASLVAQWVKNPPASAGDTDSSPVPEDPTCRGATEPVCRNY